jgi:hypothetical protein
LEMLYEQARLTSEELGAPRSDGDATAQFMPEASPAKWHLAHTTWFFEAMVLSAHADDYEPFDERLSFLSSSYYETHDARQPRPRRGVITRSAHDRKTSFRPTPGSGSSACGWLRTADSH